MNFAVADCDGYAWQPAAYDGVALIFVAKGGENCIAVAGGANQRLSPADVRKARAAITAGPPTARAATRCWPGSGPGCGRCARPRSS